VKNKRPRCEDYHYNDIIKVPATLYQTGLHVSIASSISEAIYKCLGSSESSQLQEEAWSDALNAYSFSGGWLQPKKKVDLSDT
jgi:hypothetical protein